MSTRLFCYTAQRTACMLVLDCDAACIDQLHTLAVVALVLVSFVFAAFMVVLARGVE